METFRVPSQTLHPEAKLLNHPFTPNSHLDGGRVLVTFSSLGSVGAMETGQELLERAWGLKGTL